MHRISNTSVTSVHPHHVAEVERTGRTKPVLRS